MYMINVHITTKLKNRTKHHLTWYNHLEESINLASSCAIFLRAFFVSHLELIAQPRLGTTKQQFVAFNRLGIQSSGSDILRFYVSC